ncbi:MAG: hypothetical protein ABSG33_11920 [Candidatus Bathyarchaeia archaeon]
MKTKKAPIIAIAALVSIGIVLAVLSQGLLASQQAIPSSGTVGVSSTINIGVYTDAATTNNCTSINWGTLTPGTSVSQTVYIKNTGNTAETLSMTTSSWNPPTATSYLSLTWNDAGTVLAAGSVTPATLTLTVAANAGSLNSFSFDIVISGSA